MSDTTSYAYDIEDVEIRYNENFNNIYGAVISGVANWIRTNVFPRSKDTVIGTMRKAVEMIRTRKNLAGENWTPKLPFVVINPNLEIEPEATAGRFLHGYPNFQHRWVSNMYNPRIYDDDNVYISPVLNRWTGTIDCISWCGSIYELIDLRTNVINHFGGVGRPIYPVNLDTLMIIPDEFRNYVYTNHYTDASYALDWTSNNDAEEVIIRNINQDKLCFPVSVRPYLTLESISSDSENYGGSGDMLSDYRVNFTIKWEASLPSYYVLIAKMWPEAAVKMEFVTGTDFKWLEKPHEQDSYFRIYKEFNSVSMVDETTGPDVHDMDFWKVENYQITASDSTNIINSQNFSIPLTDGFNNDIRYLRVFGKYGELNRDFHYRISDTTNLEFIGFNLRVLDEDDYLTIVYYKPYNV